MDKIYVPMGEFLKNAGIVGLWELLELSDAEEKRDYGISDNNQGLWLSTEFAANADWTDLYFQIFVQCYGSSTAYQNVLERIDGILEKLQNCEWDQKACKDDLKFINEKLLSKSYQSGFENVKDSLEHPEVYSLLKASKLKDTMERNELQTRLHELKAFLLQPLCKETFSMKSIIYSYINRFWDGKSFLYKQNVSKDMKEIFDADFSEPLRRYVVNNHSKAKDLCIDCSSLMDSKEKVSIAFMKDQADDLTRKRSAFWDCMVDAYLCPVCAFLYSLVPLGFSLIGNKFVFINMNENIHRLLSANRKNRVDMRTAERKENEKYSSWIARTLDVLLTEKTEELGNIQVIARGKDESDRYSFDIISRDILSLLKERGIQKSLDSLSKHPYIKDGKDFWNIHEEVIMNILRYRSQYYMINKILRLALDNSSLVITAGLVYDVQLKVSLKKKDNRIMGGAIMDRYAVGNSGYALRKELLKVKGASDDACLRGTIYQLINALSVGNVEHFMDIIMRVYCSTTLKVPNAFIELLKDKETFVEYGYAFVLGLQGSYYKKEGKLEEEA